jgi:VWFA-related protein
LTKGGFIVEHFSLLKRCCISLSLLVLLACSGGGGSNAPSSGPPPAPTPNIYLAQSSIDFAGIVLDNSSDRTFEIKNTGNADLKIGQISPLSLPFSIAIDACSLKTLAPSQTCLLGIRFSPTSQVISTATLSIPSNDPDSSSLNLTLSGEGYGLNVWVNKVVSTSCPSVNVDVTVTDPKSNGLLNSLTVSNFKLHHNGQLQGFTVSPIQYPSPVSVVLAVDWSNSTSNVQSAIQTGAISFINQLQNGDFAAICKFASAIEFDPSTGFRAAATEKATLIAYINSSFSGGNWTHLYDAVYQSIDRAAEGTTEKRAVIVLSDGNDESDDIGGPVHTLDQVIARAKEKEIPIFTIYYVDEINYIGKPEIMQRLASQTGGQFYNALSADFLVIFQQISNVLSNKYTLSYTSSTCAGAISLDVRADWNGLYGRDPRTISLP